MKTQTQANPIAGRREPDRARGLSLGNSAVLACSSFVLLGAVHFGLASCGGYTWHKQAFRGICIALYFAALLLPSSLLPTRRHKQLFAALLPLLFVVLESSIAPFYPGPPRSISEYMAAFNQALKFGACS